MVQSLGFFQKAGEAGKKTCFGDSIVAKIASASLKKTRQRRSQ